MTAIEKMEQALTKSADMIAIQGKKMCETEGVLSLLRTLASSCRELASEEKSNPIDGLVERTIKYSDDKALSYVNPAHVEAKATAPFRPAYCPTCQAYIKLTERRIDGDSVCINGHKHPTKDFYRSAKATAEGSLVDKDIPCGIRLEIMDVVGGNKSTGKAVENILAMFNRPASTTVEELVRELRAYTAVMPIQEGITKNNTWYACGVCDAKSDVATILDKYDNAKGGK